MASGDIFGMGQEGHSIVRPPLFNGEDYAYWKTRMRLFVQANDYEVWKIIMKGPLIPTKKVDDREVPKEEWEWDEKDTKMAQLNAKAMHTLFCALGPNEYNRVSLCDSAKEIWDKLAITHEGTNQVKESKISMLTLDYEMFKMKPEESIKEMSDRFTDIVNGLKGLGKVYPNKEMVKKMLNSLPKSWEAKVTAIEESKDLNLLALDELIGSLLTYEMKINHGKEQPRKVGVALKASMSEDEEDDDEDDEDMEMIIFAKKFKKYMKMDKGKSSQSKKVNKVVCYNCNKPGHVKPDCPLLKKKKKKAFVATWSDSDSSDDDDSKEDQIGNLCFMALNEPKVTSNSPNLNSYTFDELQDAFDDLVVEFEEMNSKHKKMISKLKAENDLLLKSKLVLENENKDLKNDFNDSKQKINILEKANFDLKRKIESLEQEKKIIFDKSLQVYMTKCSHCKFHGHNLHTCPIKKRTQFKVRQVWVPKGTRSFETNTQGPKAIWVPKTK